MKRGTDRITATAAMEETIARSFLFVPGTRPDRFAKAAASGADQIVLDLEDGVPADDKAAARRHVAAWLEAGNAGIVRVNPVGTPEGQLDLDTFADRRGLRIMVPKATADDVHEIDRALPEGSYLIPIIETARGVLEAPRISTCAKVLRLAFGNGDLAQDLGLRHDNWTGLQWARSTLVCASAAAGIAAPIDGVVTALDDAALLAAECAGARDLGFSGKLCIHPAQASVVNQSFLPSEEELRWARGILHDGGTSGGGVSTVDGEMVDKPIRERAARVLWIAERMAQ